MADTLTGPQVDSYGPNQDPLTGIGADLGQTGAGQGNTIARHPNSTAMPQ